MIDSKLKNTYDNYFKLQDIKKVLILAIPVIIENILQVFLGTTDTFFASKLNPNAIASIGITNLIINVYIAFFTAIGVGTTAIVARNIGLNDKKNATETVKQSIILSLGISLIIGLISLLFSRQILTLLGATSEVIEYALPYFISVSVPCVFLSLSLTLSSSLRGSGNTKTPMIASTVAIVLNIMLNYILIFGIFNFNGIGILGAGIATTISRAVSVLILFVSLYIGKSGLKLNFNEKWIINKKLILSISKIGIPAGIEKLIMRFGQLSYNSLIISIGTSAYVAHNIAGNIESYSYLPAMGFGVAATTLIGTKLGEDNPMEAKKYGLISNLLSTIVMVIIGILFYIAAPSLAQVFTSDTEIQELVVSVLRIIALFQPFLSLTMVISCALQGAGDTKFPMYSTFIGIWGIRVIFGYIFAILLNLGLVGIWLAYSLDITVRGIILLVRFLSGKWAEIKIS
ncbi:MAG: MATE family efflux transporter [Peptostreptococcaceae bacterium]